MNKLITLAKNASFFTIIVLYLTVIPKASELTGDTVLRTGVYYLIYYLILHSFSRLIRKINSRFWKNILSLIFITFLTLFVFIQVLYYQLQLTNQPIAFIVLIAIISFYFANFKILKS